MSGYDLLVVRQSPTLQIRSEIAPTLAAKFKQFLSNFQWIFFLFFCSDEDIRWFYDSETLYIILSIADSVTTIQTLPLASNGTLSPRQWLQN